MRATDNNENIPKSGSGHKFQPYWTEKFGMVESNGKAMCVLCENKVVCRTSNVKRHLETCHTDLPLDESEKKQFLKRNVWLYHSKKSTQNVICDSVRGNITPLKASFLFYFFYLTA